MGIFEGKITSSDTARIRRVYNSQLPDLARFGPLRFEDGAEVPFCVGGSIRTEEQEASDIRVRSIFVNGGQVGGGWEVQRQGSQVRRRLYRALVDKKSSINCSTVVAKAGINIKPSAQTRARPPQSFA